MAIDEQRLQKNLDRIKKGQYVPFKLVRGGECGTPALWREKIVYEADKAQSFETLRSAADEGGFAIGKWQSPATVSILPELVHALEISGLWHLDAEPIEPGAEYINWSFTIGDADNSDTFDLVLAHASAKVMGLVELDTLMRRIAAWLYQSNQGYQLNCVSDIEESDQAIQVKVSVENNGTIGCNIPNPMVMDWNDTNYLSVEVALPEDPLNPTGLGLVYQSLPLKVEPNMVDRWQQAYLNLPPKTKITFPVAATFFKDQYKGGYLRSVYSCYEGNEMTDSVVDPSLDKLFGRAFSIEQPL